MSVEIKQIAADNLRRMEGHEGIVFEGCADPQGWVDGLNDDLTKAGILLDGTKLQNVSSFQRDGGTCLFFDFEGVKLNMGKLAMWRLQTHAQLGGTWFSDYVPNRLGGFVQEEQKREKPDCELIGQNGNIFALMGIASGTLKDSGMEERSKEMCARIMGSGSYEEALGIIGEYVNITGPAETEAGLDMEGFR